MSDALEGNRIFCAFLVYLAARRQAVRWSCVGLFCKGSSAGFSCLSSQLLRKPLVYNEAPPLLCPPKVVIRHTYSRSPVSDT